jgi:short-subunit dehydrogenase
MKVDGSVAIVTGASHGIGYAAAFALHSRGAAVGLIARSGEELEAATTQLGTRAAYALADVGNKDEIDRAVAKLSEQLGPPDILVNNAGVGAYGSALEEDPQIYERLMRVNYLGTVHATLAVLPKMVARRRGHIVNVASVAGRLGAPFEAAYSASKFAVVGLSESLAAELQSVGIRVSLVNPGPVSTKFTEARGVPFQRSVPRPLAPERVAAAIVRAVERDRFEQTLPHWLRIGTVVRGLSPNLYHRGLLRSTSKESDALASRMSTAPQS